MESKKFNDEQLRDVIASCEAISAKGRDGKLQGYEVDTVARRILAAVRDEMAQHMRVSVQLDPCDDGIRVKATVSAPTEVEVIVDVDADFTSANGWTEEDRAVVGFCSMCFASTESGSWGCTVYGDHCSNCGTGGAVVSIPRWSVDAIRENASWVGKRYYSAEEDFDHREELEALRRLAPDDPRRVATETENGRFNVTQPLRGGGTISISTRAYSADEALAKLKADLPYIPPANEEEYGL